MEIEAKYRLLSETDPHDLDSLDLSPYRLEPDQQHPLDDTILDTQERTLTNAGHALRVRHDGARILLTLKGPGNVEGAVHRREELESELHGSEMDRDAWPTDIREAVSALIGTAELIPLAKVQNQRHTWRVLKGEIPIAELAYDRGVVSAAGREDPFRELELELKGDGQESDLTALDLRLREALQVEAEPRSKLKRALALLRKSERGNEPTTTKAEGTMLVESDPPQLTPPAWRPVDEVGREIARRQLAKLAEAEAIARDDSDIEGVHDMRVSTRRLRAALSVLESAQIDADRCREFRRELRRVANALGEVRDLDVFLAHLSSYRDEQEIPQDEGLDRLARYLERRRDDARRVMLAALDSRKTRRALQTIEAWSQEPAAALDRSQLVPQPRLVRHVARSAIWLRFEEILAYEQVMPTPPVPTLHQLRVSAKRMRYTLEFFEEALGEEVKGLLKTLTTTQDHLGELQDDEVAIAVIDKVLHKHRDLASLLAYRLHRDARRANLVETFHTRWDKLSGATFVGRLEAALEVL